MFDRWKKRSAAREDHTKAEQPERDEERVGGEDAAVPALAGAAEDESPTRASSRIARIARIARSEYSANERARLVALFNRSDLTVRAFAQQHDVKFTTFRNWLYRRNAKHKPLLGKAKRFTPDERRAAVEAFAKSGRTRADFARLWGCSASSLDKWLARYRDEGPKGLETRAPRKGRQAHHPRRTSDAVRELIVELRKQHDDYGVTRIANYLKRFHGVQLSPSTVRNVLREKGIAPQPSPARRARPKSKLPRRFERARPGELWQSDITSYVLRRQGRRVYLTVFLDDHSRYVVAWALATHQRTPLVTEPLLEGIARFGKPREVLTDQGRQYFAWRGKSGFQKLLAREGIAHVVSRTHHPETLGKCERLWKTIGDEFWDRAAPQDLDDARRRLGHWLRHYNHFRPHQGIDGLVPADRFFDAESTLRVALERELAQNELRQALDQAPRQPVYLVGQIGTQRIALHGERGKLVIDTPDGERRELAMDELGIQTHSEAQENEDGDQSDRAAEQAGNVATAGSEARASGSQAIAISEDAAASVAGARPVGECAARGEEACARDVHEGAGVLAGQEGERRDREGTVDHATARVATESASAVGDDGGTLDAAATARESAGLRGQPGGITSGAEEAHRAAREGAVTDGGSGACAANSPVAESDDGVTREGRLETCPNEGQQADDASQEKCASESETSCERPSQRAGRVWRWLKRTE